MQQPASPTVFSGGDLGAWSVLSHTTLNGPAIPAFDRLAITPAAEAPAGARWQARGVNSHLRYTSQQEQRELSGHAAPSDRGDRCAVLIPMSKCAAWWGMAQDQRLAIYARSRHMRIGMSVLPEVARTLYHGRDLGEPFDFITWFEFDEPAEAAFEAMLDRLRASEEWDYVCAETMIRLRR